jgi:hypothetical protein
MHGSTMTKRDEEPGSKVEVVCPKCRRAIAVGAAEAAKRMKVRCACGEVVPLVKAF